MSFESCKSLALGELTLEVEQFGMKKSGGASQDFQRQNDDDHFQRIRHVA